MKSIECPSVRIDVALCYITRRRQLPPDEASDLVDLTRSTPVKPSSLVSCGLSVVFHHCPCPPNCDKSNQLRFGYWEDCEDGGSLPAKSIFNATRQLSRIGASAFDQLEIK